MTAPSALDVGRVVRPPGAGTQPRVPVAFFLGWLRFLGKPGMAHLGGIPRRDMGTNRLDLAEPAGTGELDRRHERAFAEPLNPGLVHASVSPSRLDNHPAF